MTVQKIAYFLLLFCAGCTTDIKIPLPETDNQLVLVGNFTSNQAIQVRVTTLQTVQDTLAPDYPLDATVHLLADGNLVDVLKPALDTVSMQWMYRGEVQPIQGVRYRLEVEAPGHPDIWAADALPPADVSPVFIVDTAKIEKTAERWVVPVKIQMSTLPANNTHPWFMFSIEAETGLYEQQNNQWILQHILRWPVLANADVGTAGYVNQAANYYALVKADFWTENASRTLSLSIEYPFLSPAIRPHSLILVWRTITEAGYRFYNTVNRQGDYDSPIGSPDAVYNNVIGGWGNFSGYVERRDTVYF